MTKRRTKARTASSSTRCRGVAGEWGGGGVDNSYTSDPPVLASAARAHRAPEC